MQNGLDAITQVQIAELRRDIDKLDERMQSYEMRLARLEGRDEERDDRTRRTAENRQLRDRRELAGKIIAGTVTVALAVVSALVSVMTAAKC